MDTLYVLISNFRGAGRNSERCRSEDIRNRPIKMMKMFFYFVAKEAEEMVNREKKSRSEV